MSGKKRKALTPPETPRPNTSGGQRRRFGEQSVLVDAVYHVSAIAPKTAGVWSVEAEKVAWQDPSSGYGCIIRRSPNGGHLGGYVGVGPEHPLFGFEVNALRGLGIKVHGGISYAKECEKHEDERTTRTRTFRESMSICHVVTGPEVVHQHTTKKGRTVLDVRPHDDLWWIGFECNQPYDVLPEANAPGARTSATPKAPAGTVERVYRDEAYVFDQCVWLAEQLAAVKAGRDLAEVDERSTPAVGFDPSKAAR